MKTPTAPSGLLALNEAQWRDIGCRLDRLAANAPSGALLTVTLPLGHGDTCNAGHDWLDRQPKATEVCYWSQADSGSHRLGLGRAVVCTSAGPARFTALQAAFNGIAQQWLHDAGGTDFQPFACIGFAFDDDSADVLPNAQLGVAAVVLDNQHGALRASFTTPAREAATAVARWQALLTAEPGEPQRPVVGHLADPTLAQRAWQLRVDAALQAIADGKVRKLVLSRSRRLSLADDRVGAALLRRLLSQHRESTVFAMGTAKGFFCGATPERLLSFRDGEVQTDALAGTAWGEAELAVDKNLREQQLVVEAIRASLLPLCRTLDVPPAPTVMHLRELQHLHTPISGHTHAGVGLFDLLARLHPTPAVGGWPTAPAREWLRHHDERRPGWYGGGFGWIDRAGNGEIAVALRCGLITPGRIELSAGAGIVAGSTAAHEFDETEAKLGTMLAALRDADAGTQQTGTRG